MQWSDYFVFVCSILAVSTPTQGNRNDSLIGGTTEGQANNTGTGDTPGSTGATSSHLNPAVIAGGTVGLVSLVVIVLVVAAVINRKRSSAKQQDASALPENGSAYGSTTDGTGGYVNEGAGDIMNDIFLSIEDVRALMAVANLGHPVSTEHLSFSQNQAIPQGHSSTGNNTSNSSKPKNTRSKDRNTRRTKEAGKPASDEQAGSLNEEPYARVKKKPKRKNESPKNTTEQDTTTQGRVLTADADYMNYQSQVRQSSDETPEYKNIGEMSHNRLDQGQPGDKTKQSSSPANQVPLAEFTTRTKTKAEARSAGNTGDGNATRKAAGTTTKTAKAMTKTAEDVKESAKDMTKTAKDVTKTAETDDDYQRLHFSRQARVVEEDEDPTYNHISKLNTGRAQ